MSRKSKKSSPRRRPAKDIAISTCFAGYMGSQTVTLTMTIDEAAAILYAAGYAEIDGVDLSDVGMALDDSGDFGTGVPGLLQRVQTKYLSKKVA
jgi:hypothetical protein